MDKREKSTYSDNLTWLALQKDQKRCGERRITYSDLYPSSFPWKDP